MTQRFNYPFHCINSTEPSFQSTLGSTNHVYAIESTARKWQGPSSRVVRFASKQPDDFYLAFGTSDVVAVSTGSMLGLGGVRELHYLAPSQTHVAIMSSTDVEVNFTLGYGN